MSGTGSWLQFANRMNKFKGSYFQDFADISGDIIVRNTGNVYLQAGSSMYITAGDISMNGFVYCKGVVDLSGNSLSGGGDGGGGGLTSVSTVNVKSINTTDFMTTGGYATVGNYLNVTGSTTLNGILITNSNSVFNGHLDGSDASFNSMSVGNVELKGSIIPDINSVYDIGSIDKKIRDLYVSEGSIWVGDNNKLAVENNKIIMKRRKRGDTDIPKFIKDKISFPSLTEKITHVKTFASSNSLGKTSSDLLSTYTVADWIRFANKKTELGITGFTNTNHTASDIYDLTDDFDNDDSGQWSTTSTGVIEYDGKAVIGSSANTAALEIIGKSTLLGNVAIGGYSTSTYALYVNGGSRFNSNLLVEGISTLSTTNIGASLTVSQNTNITGKMGVGKAADGTHHLDVLGSARIQNDAYFKKSLLVGTGVNTTSLATHNATGASMYIETPLVAGVYPDISHNVVINVPNTVFQANDTTTITNTNYLEIDASKRSILPYVRDVNGNLVNSGMTNGWELGGPGAYRFDKIHARDINISTETINIEDGSGNKIGMSFDATTGSVNYTVVTKDTADASGETFVIKGVQTQKISSGGGTIDPALLEFTGLSFGDTFDSTLTYNLSSTYNYNLTTTTYTGDGISAFVSSAGAQGLSSFISANNITTLLGDIPTKKSSVIRVGVDDRSDGGLYGIDTVGNKIDLTNKVISVSDNDGGTTLKWTLWGSEAELNATTPGNYLNFIELKNINMVSGTYFVAKTSGTIVYNNSNEDYLKNNDLVGVVNGDLFLYINRSPGNNWTKIPVSLPASGSITTQMLTDSVIQPGKIAANAITESKILNGAVTTNKIADGSITAVKFKAGEINGTIFADDAIDGTKISGNIATSKLVGEISGSLISDNTIVSSKIVDGAVTSAKIAYLGVSGDNLMENSVTTIKIMDNAVTTDKIQDGGITSVKLASGIINTDTLLADNLITTNKILGGAVTDAKLASNSISTSKIQDGSITTAKLAPNSVTIDKISGTVFSGKQDTLVAGTGINIAINGAGAPVISSTVTSSVGTGDITTDMIADGSITLSKLADGVSVGGGGGGGGGAVSGDIIVDTILAGDVVSPGIIYGTPVQITGPVASQLGYQNISSFQYGSWTNNVHINDAENLIVTSDKNRNTYIYEYSANTWSIKQTINFPVWVSGAEGLNGNGDSSILSNDGTTIAIIGSVVSFTKINKYIYIYKDSSSSWNSIPTKILLSHIEFPDTFGRSVSMSSDGSKLAVVCSKTSGQTVFVYSTAATTDTPLITIPLDSSVFQGVAGVDASVVKVFMSGDGNKLLLYTGYSSYTENCYVLTLNYQLNTHVVEFNWRSTAESTGVTVSAGWSNFIGISISRDGTRLFVPIRTNTPLNGKYLRLYVYHFESSAWVLKTTLGQTDIWSVEPLLSGRADNIAARSYFVNNNKIIVMASAYYHIDYADFVYVLEYDANTTSWIKTYITNFGISSQLKSGFGVTPNASFVYIESQAASNSGVIYYNKSKYVSIVADYIRANNIAVDDKMTIGTLSHATYGDCTTISTGTSVMNNGKMYIISDVLNVAGSGAVNTSTYRNFDNSPTLILGHNDTTGAVSSANSRPSIQFRSKKLSSLDPLDWRIYTELNAGVDLHIQNGSGVNALTLTSVPFSAYGGLTLNYNIIGVNGGADRASTTSIGQMWLKPKHIALSGGICKLLYGNTGYPVSTRGGYAFGMEFYTAYTNDAMGSIWSHEQTTHFKLGDMSIMSKKDLNFYTGVVKWSNFGEVDQSAYKRMAIGGSGGVGIGTDPKSDYALLIKGNVDIEGSISATAFAQPFVSRETANIIANTTIATLNGGDDTNSGLGSSNGDKICMNGDGNLTVLANVDLKTVYTFRNINNVWETFATVSTNATKYIYKNTPYFGKVIALSRDGLTLAISDRKTVWIYKWNSGTSAWVEQGITCSDVNYATNNTTVAFCHNMKITDDGSKLLILSFNSVSIWTLRIYDTATGTSLVTVTDNTSGIDPSAVTGANPYYTYSSHRGLQNWYRWQIALSGDGTSAAISGRASGDSTYFRNTLLYDIEYSGNTSSINSTFNVGSTGKNMNGREMALNNDGTVFAISVGRGSAFTYADDLDKPRVNIYRRSLVTPTVWNLEKVYAPMPELEGKGSGLGDGFGEKITMNLDGSVIFIGAHFIEFWTLLQTPIQHFIGRVAFKNNSWGDMNVISGPVSSYWGLGIVTSSIGTILSVANLRDWTVTAHGGGFHSYIVQIPDLTLTGPNELILNGGGYATAGHFRLDAGGNIGIGVAPVSNIRLNVAGDIAATGTITAGSDDRLKENETLIADAITTIKKLRPEIYDKKPTFDNVFQDEWSRESGIIAQELWYTNPELRHLIKIGCKVQETQSLKEIKYNDTNGLIKSFYLDYGLDPSGNIQDCADIFILDDSGNIFIDISGNTHIDKNKFLLLDMSGNCILYNGNQVLDYNKLKNKNITGIAYKKIVVTPKTDDDGTIITDICGNVITIDEEVDVLGEDGIQLINPLEILTFIYPPFVVKIKTTETRPKTEMVTEYKYTQIKPEEIIDYTPNTDIRTDPDYTALGWGDTPSQFNYIGLIPYLVKAIQEQQDIIDQLKADVDTLKNA